MQRDYVIKLRGRGLGPKGTVAGIARATSRGAALGVANLLFINLEHGVILTVHAPSECTPREQEAAAVIELLLAWRRLDKVWAGHAANAVALTAANAAKGRR